MEYPAGWNDVGGTLEREFRFNDFSAAIDFVNRVAEAAEESNHHPDLAVHWNRVIVRWSTHSAGGITDRDVEMAAWTDKLV